ncbi:MAG: hypothetical protein PHP95_09445 [Desulfuromonadaceae bacterium]|nr:hypothetical protein [Desulfuromonadaceae bacterium]MDD2848668.1 hypothetical protein [Desulfuromonadaceae bacterium]MDD4130829.1 hypothetical protein [Desulfuromonadaceae bacterium]
MKKETFMTFTGVEICSALKELDRLLPPGAYKPICCGPGAKAGLTDINPNFALELICEIFGPLGLGWGYEELEFRPDGQYCGIKLRVWYGLYNDSGEMAKTIEWTARGGNYNGGNREWSEKGALTNALGAAWSLQGLQLSVYKGLRNHESVHKEWRSQLTPDPPATSPLSTAVDANPSISLIEKLEAAKIPFKSAEEAIYALPAYNNAIQRKIVSDAGGKWDSRIPASRHRLRNKDGVFVLKKAA